MEAGPFPTRPIFPRLPRTLLCANAFWMIAFRPIADDESALAQSPLLRATLLTFDYLQEHGPIGLTPSRALKRYFVTWAATAFEWPHYTAEDLFTMNKVLNEQDFPPLMVLHDVLLSAKLARHHKGALHATKLGKELRRRPGELWAVLAEHLLFVLDHEPYTRFGDSLTGDWDIFLNIINVEAQTGLTEERFRVVLFGVDEVDMRLASLLYVHVLRPLCWSGLLIEHRHGEPYPSKRLYTKSPLWPVVLDLETDSLLSPATQH